MDAVREFYQILRWRLIAVRWLGKAASYFTAPALPRRRLAPASDTPVARDGFGPGPSIPPAMLAEIQAIYRPRAEAVVPRTSGHPFENLMRAEDFNADNPVLRYAFSPDVLGAADAYFGGAFRFDSIQMLYSYPTEGDLRESQMWHRDYGDSKSFHCVAYVSDVLVEADGPFVFVDKRDTRRIASSLLIRRIGDEQFRRELGDGEIRSFTGKAGEAVLVDPAACYHFGSRCRNGRLALFVTFNTDRPYVGAQPLMRENRSALLAAAKAIRPDLDPAYLERILSI